MKHEIEIKREIVIYLSENEAQMLKFLAQNIHPDYMSGEEIPQFAKKLFNTLNNRLNG